MYRVQYVQVRCNPRTTYVGTEEIRNETLAYCDTVHVGSEPWIWAPGGKEETPSSSVSGTPLLAKCSEFEFSYQEACVCSQFCKHCTGRVRNSPGGKAKILGGAYNVRLPPL